MKTVIEMAREAGLPFGQRGVIPLWDKELERFAELVRADEREACADAVESTAWSDWFRTDCAAAIRARSRNENSN